MTVDMVTTKIDGYIVECYHPSGALVVIQPEKRMSVLRLGTHSALDKLGEGTKQRIVEWWEEVR